MSEPNGYPANGDAVEAIKVAEEAKAEAVRALRLTRNVELALVTVAAVAAVAAMSLSAWNSYRTREFGRIIADCTTPGGACYEANRQSSLDFRTQVKNLISEVGQCQTLQLLQHRDANEKAHTLNADEHGYRYRAPASEIPPPIPEQLRAACDQFIPKERP